MLAFVSALLYLVFLSLFFLVLLYLWFLPFLPRACTRIFLLDLLFFLHRVQINLNMNYVFRRLWWNLSLDASSYALLTNEIITWALSMVLFLFFQFTVHLRLRTRKFNRDRMEETKTCWCFWARFSEAKIIWLKDASIRRWILYGCLSRKKKFPLCIFRHKNWNDLFSISSTLTMEVFKTSLFLSIENDSRCLFNEMINIDIV